jgi:hypothetical protein
VFLHLRHNLQICQLVRGVDRNTARGQSFGATKALLELQLRFTWSKEEKSVRLAKLTDDIVVKAVKVLAVPFLVLLLPSVFLRAGVVRVRPDIG